MKIVKALGPCYLCSTFVNSDGTKVSDHPLFAFETDEDGVWAYVMFASKVNPYTAKYPDGNDITFITCSDHPGEFPGKRVFQAELYIGPKTVKLSEYTFAQAIYCDEMMKALRNAIKYREKGAGLKHVHNYNETKDREDTDEIISSLLSVVEDNIRIKRYKPTGPVNCVYDEYRKIRDSERIKRGNYKVFDERYKNKAH